MDHRQRTASSGRREAQGIDDLIVIQGVQMLAVVQIPQEGLVVVTSGCAQGIMWRYGNRCVPSGRSSACSWPDSRSWRCDRLTRWSGSSGLARSGRTKPIRCGHLPGWCTCTRPWCSTAWWSGSGQPTGHSWYSLQNGGWTFRQLNPTGAGFCPTIRTGRSYRPTRGQRRWWSASGHTDASGGFRSWHRRESTSRWRQDHVRVLRIGSNLGDPYGVANELAAELQRFNHYYCSL